MIKPKQEWSEFINQCYWIGYKSLVAVTGFIMGLVLTIQSRPTLVEFGSSSLLPAMVSVSLVREITPVITSLICAGKIGSGIGAELGSMRGTEQIDAMEVSGTNPFKYLVVTRVLASTVMVPVLSVLAIGISLFGGYLGANIRGDVSWTLFWFQAYDSLSYGDFIPALVKTIFFGFAIGIVGCFKGYNSKMGTEGVGRSATTAVIVASLLVFVIDLIAVQITDLLAQQVMQHLNTVLAQVESGSGTAGMVISDSVFKAQILRTMENVEQSTFNFNQNMEALKHNFLFRRCFREMEKEKQ